MNLFAIPVFSFIPTKYRALVKENGSKIFGALLICFILLGILTAAYTISTFRGVMDALRQECPYFAMKDGTLSIEKPLVVDQDNLYLRIDDSIEDVTVYDIDDLSKNRDTVVMIGRTGGGIYQNGMIRVFDYKGFGDFDKNTLFDGILPVLNALLTIAFIIAPFFSIGLYYLVALILQFLTGGLSSVLFKTELSNTERFRITVLGKFPPYLLVYVLRYFGIFIGSAVNLLLQIAFIVLVLYFYSSDIEYEDADDYAFAD